MLLEISGELTTERMKRWSQSKNNTQLCRSCRFNPWVWKIPWRRAWQPTPVFLPENPHGQRNLVGYKVAKGKT